jgi:hypothetical protein
MFFGGAALLFAVVFTLSFYLLAIGGIMFTIGIIIFSFGSGSRRHSHGGGGRGGGGGYVPK